MFLSQLSLDEYHQKEERFSQELSHFTKKKFFEVKFSFFQNISIKLKKKMIDRIKLMVINIACSNYVLFTFNDCRVQQMWQARVKDLVMKYWKLMTPVFH